MVGYICLIAASEIVAARLADSQWVGPLRRFAAISEAIAAPPHSILTPGRRRGAGRRLADRAQTHTDPHGCQGDLTPTRVRPKLNRGNHHSGRLTEPTTLAQSADPGPLVLCPYRHHQPLRLLHSATALWSRVYAWGKVLHLGTAFVLTLACAFRSLHLVRKHAPRLKHRCRATL